MFPSWRSSLLCDKVSAETENSSLIVLVAGVPQTLQNLSSSLIFAPHFEQWGQIISPSLAC
jgi:hypothetical protein